MMLVYKEDSTPTITAPTYPRLTVGDSNTKLGNLECCVSAVETINALATDMSVYVEEARILRKGIFCDYISLLQILAYYLYFPLRAAASDFNALSDHWPLDEVSNTGTNNERIPSIFSKLQARRKNFQACYTKLTRLIMVIENRLNNLPKLKTTNWSSPLDRLRRASLHNEKVGIPSTGPIEILFRMTALDSGASSIGQ